MQMIAFVPSSSQDHTRGLAHYSGGELAALHEGDIVWLITRMSDARATPALCGRIVIGGHHGHAPEDARAEGKPDVDASERCDPFPCDTVRSWHVWRAPFEGLAELTETQAACLETYWIGARGRRVKHPGG